MCRTHFVRLLYVFRTLPVRMSYACARMTHVQGPQMPTYDNYAYERVRNAYDKTYDKIMRTTKSRNVRQYSYACRTRTQEARTTTVRTGPKNVVRVYNCRTSVMCFVRLSYACRTTPTIPYDMRTDSVRNTYSRRTKCVRHEKSSSHQLINRYDTNSPEFQL